MVASPAFVGIGDGIARVRARRGCRCPPRSRRRGLDLELSCAFGVEDAHRMPLSLETLRRSGERVRSALWSLRAYDQRGVATPARPRRRPQARALSCAAFSRDDGAEQSRRSGRPRGAGARRGRATAGAPARSWRRRRTLPDGRALAHPILEASPDPRREHTHRSLVPCRLFRRTALQEGASSRVRGGRRSPPIGRRSG